MGTFNTQKLLNANPSLIPIIASNIESELSAEGYNVLNQQLLNGATDISITKGGFFKAVLGLKTALKVSLKPQGYQIFFNASVGIFGQQIIPFLIMYYVAWPVLLTQIWGLVQQSKLDDKVLSIAERTIRENGQSLETSQRPVATAYKRFCTYCGAGISTGAEICPICGNKDFDN